MTTTSTRKSTSSSISAPWKENPTSLLVKTPTALRPSPRAKIFIIIITTPPSWIPTSSITAASSAWFHRRRRYAETVCRRVFVGRRLRFRCNDAAHLVRRYLMMMGTLDLILRRCLLLGHRLRIGEARSKRRAVTDRRGRRVISPEICVNSFGDKRAFHPNVANFCTSQDYPLPDQRFCRRLPWRRN